MLRQFPLSEAQNKLPELIQSAVEGDEVIIWLNDKKQAVQLIPVARPNRKAKFGSAKGLIHIADDFDAPLEDFREYMP
ncbi:MAG: DUF2281 domain-containing protein [Anaerolineales bacterium]